MTKIETIQIELERLSRMASQWQSAAEVSTIERELMLARLRDLYEMVRFELDATPAVAPAEPMAEEQTPIVAVAATVAVAEAPMPTETPMAEEAEELLPDDALVGIDMDALLAFEPFAEQPAPATEEVAEPEVEEELPATEEVAEEQAEVMVEAEAQPEPEAATAPEAPEITEETPAVEVEPEVEVDPVEPEIPAEKEAEIEPEVAPVVEPEPMPVAAPQNLFGEEEQVARHRHKQRVIMSLYDAPMPTVETPATPVAPVEIPVEAPVETPAETLVVPAMPRAEEVVPAESELVAVECEPSVIELFEEDLAPEEEVLLPAEPETPVAVLGEVIQPVQTLADTITPPRDMASELRYREPITDLRRAVGINDKFLLIRDLFNGNGSLYEITIRRLNEFDNFDDCMIYIAENFAWNPNSDGARLIMELLERKFDQK